MARFPTRLVLLLLPLICACGTDPLPPVMVGGERPAISVAEFEKRLGRIEALVAEGRSEEAQEEIGETLRDWPPDHIRRRLQRISFEIRRNRFYRDHPLHLSLEIPRDRYFFDERVEVSLRVTNLGKERLRLPVNYRTWWQALTFQEGERSVLTLRVVSRDADGTGSHWSTARNVDVALAEDLVLAPGGSETIVTVLDQEDSGRSLFRLLRIGAIYRPIAILGEDGERRYDPLQFPEASGRVFRREHAHFADGGVAMIETLVAGEAPARTEGLFVAAVGLAVDDLHRGLEILARAAPSLDPLRQRRAVAALGLLTGQEFANDPVRFLGWWEQTGRFRTADELREAAGLVDIEGVGRLEVGVP